MFNTRALYAWIALMAFSLGWIAQGWHRDNILLKQRMLITLIEDQANKDVCLDLQLSSSLFDKRSFENDSLFLLSHHEVVKSPLKDPCASADFITIFNNTRCEVGNINLEDRSMN